MSTILKALRRLEEQKSRDGAPRPLREEIASGPGERSPRRGAPWLLVVALLLGAGIGASVWWFWPYERVNEPLEVAAAEPATRTDPIGEPAPAAPPDAPAAALQPSEPVAQDAASMTAEQKMEELRAQLGNNADEAFASLVEVVKRPPAEPRIAPVAPKPDAAARNEMRQAALARQRSRAAARAAAPAPAPEFAAAQPDAATGSSPAAEPPPAPRAASRAPAPAASNSAPAPSVREDDRDWPLTSEWEEPASGDLDAPRGERSSPAHVATTTTVGAEDVRVKRTQWHPEHARRSAEIAWSGKDHSVHEGDVVGEYVVQEIKPSGVVLTRYGEQIERRVGAK